MNELLAQSGLQIGAGGLVVLVVLLIFSGRLVTRRQLTDLRSDCEARLRDAASRNAELALERDTWRVACERSEAARLVQQSQGAEQSEQGRTIIRMLSALPQPADRGQGVSGGASVAQLPAAAP